MFCCHAIQDAPKEPALANNQEETMKDKDDEKW